MAQSRPLVIKDVRIFTGESFIEKGYVIADNGKIVETAAGEPTNIPSSAEVLSRPNHTLIPGLIDAHIHADEVNIPSVEQSLRFGVTSACDLGNLHDDVITLRKMNADPNNLKRYATIFHAGTAATCKGGWPEPLITFSPGLADRLAKWIKVSSPADAEPFVEAQVNVGASYIKMMHESGFAMAKYGMMEVTKQMDRDTRRAVVAAARARDLRVVCHAFEYNDSMDVVVDGIDGFAHLFMNRPPDGEKGLQRFVDLALLHDVHMCPTLVIINSLTSEGTELTKRFTEHPLAKRMLMYSELNMKQVCGCFAAANEMASGEYAIEAARAIYKGGMTLLAGTDCGSFCPGVTYGLSLYHEMHLFVHKVGMVPVDVLRSATSLVAQRMKLPLIGSLQPGYKADLVLVEGDVEAIMKDEQTTMWPLKGVWHEGVLVEAWEGHI